MMGIWKAKFQNNKHIKTFDIKISRKKNNFEHRNNLLSFNNIYTYNKCTFTHHHHAKNAIRN